MSDEHASFRIGSQPRGKVVPEVVQLRRTIQGTKLKTLLVSMIGRLAVAAGVQALVST